MKRLAIGVALLGLAACDRSQPEALDTANEAALSNEVELVNETVPPLPPPTPEPVVTENTTAVAEPSAPPLPDEDQLRADAEASGMTSRLPAEEEAQPAEGADGEQ